MGIAVNSLWIGNAFSYLELLTMKSFIDHGYDFNLWVYNKNLQNLVPEGVVIRDANQIIPESKVFAYKNFGDCRQGSVGGFSDLFRYYLIYKEGGIYVDMDVTCLDYFDFFNEYHFRPHKQLHAVGNIFKAPAGCSFLQSCIEETEKRVTENNDDWMLPVRIFSEMIAKHNLIEYIMPIEYYGYDDANQIFELKTERYYTYKKKFPKYGIHWCREASYGRWQTCQRYNWHKPKQLSVFYCLLAKHNLVSKIDSV